MKSEVFRRRFGLSFAALMLAGCVMSQDNGSHAQANKTAPGSAGSTGTAKRGGSATYDYRAGQLPAHQAEHGMDGDASAADADGATFSYYQSGRASWYGPGFHGRRTASGERYDMHALTAAHRTLPLGTYVRVTVLATGKSVVVRINDRGAFPRSRVIDLSYAAAETLGLRRAGTAFVRIERLVARDGGNGAPVGLAPAQVSSAQAGKKLGHVHSHSRARSHPHSLRHVAKGKTKARAAARVARSAKKQKQENQGTVPSSISQAQ